MAFIGEHITSDILYYCSHVERFMTRTSAHGMALLSQCYRMIADDIVAAAGDDDHVTVDFACLVDTCFN